MDHVEKIGIMGGTFSPIHYGHLMLAQWASNACHLDKVLIVPTGCSYLKQSIDIPSGEVRLEMTSLAINNNPSFEVSDIEVKRQGNTYTYETLQQLHDKYPNAHLFFIIGADCLFSIEQWVKSEEIFSNCTLIAASRDGVSQEGLLKQKEYLTNTYKADIELLEFPQIDLSSTQIRRMIQNKESIKYMLPEAVEDYIYANGLYQ